MANSNKQKGGNSKKEAAPKNEKATEFSEMELLAKEYEK